MFYIAFSAILLALLGTGAWALTRLRLTVDDVLEELWYAGVLGLLILGTVASLMGFAGLYARWPLTVMVLVVAVATLRWWRPLFSWERWRETWRDLTPVGLIYLVPLILLVIILGIYAYLATAPNVQWDTLAHHFLLPWMYLRAGAITDLPQVPMSYFPSLLQVTYGLGMGIGGEPTASLLGWWWSSWVILGVLVIGRRLWSWQAGIAGAVVMASMELYGVQLLGGWADSGVALFVLLGAYAPLRWHRTGDRAWMYFGGLAMGGALAASKHNALLPFGLVVMGMVWWWVRERRTPLPPGGGTSDMVPQSVLTPGPSPVLADSQGRGESNRNRSEGSEGALLVPPPGGRGASPQAASGSPIPSESASLGEGLGVKNRRASLALLAAYIGLALLPPLMWYLRAYHLTGNPVYPLTLWGTFPGPELPLYVESSWVDASYQRSPWSALTYPYFLTIGRSLLDEYQAHLPWQWLLGIPILWIWRGRSTEVRWWTWLLLATLAVMYIVAPKETRYMLFAMPWLALLTGLGIQMFFSAIQRPVIVALLSILLLAMPLMRNQSPIPEKWNQARPVLLGQEARWQYVARAAPVTAAIARMNHELPDDAFVFCLEDRMYRLERDWTNYYAATEPFPTTAESSYTFCFRQGVTHLFLGDGTITQPTVVRNIIDLPPNADGMTRFTLDQVMFNVLGERIDQRHHWVGWFTTRRSLRRAGVSVAKNAAGQEEYSIDRDLLLATEVQRAHYGVINALSEMYRRGWLKVVYSNGLGMVLEIDYRDIAAYEDSSKFGVGRPKGL